LQNQRTAQSDWRILPLVIADQQRHIDESERLLASASPGDPATLYWSIAHPAGLVLGFSQNEQVLNQEAVAARQLPIYYRRAGGTAVLVGPHLLSLDVILPAGHPLILSDIVESYRWFGEAWVNALLLFSVQTRIVSIQEARAQQALRKQPETRERETLLHRACYGTLSPYEVAVGQRKVVGLDMIRRRTGALLQAGIVLHWETETLADVLGHTPAEQAKLRDGLVDRAIGIDTLAGRVIPVEEIVAAFERVVVEM
jgi:lipoate-protein ligase A